MKRRSIIAANWKMNGNLPLVEEMIKGLSFLELNENVDVVVCPSFPFLSAFSSLNEKTQSRVYLGAQNVSHCQSGALTGEVSTEMLNEFAVQYVIVGHSERRSLFGETSVLIAKKVAKVLEAGLTPILCVGESETERDNKETNRVLAEQIQPVIDAVGIEKFVDVVIAYEPVWAIGTGKTASPEMAQETHQFIREYIAQCNTDIANKVPLLYGGSMNAANCENLLAQSDIDGGLIGGASLKVDEFKVICLTAKGN